MTMTTWAPDDFALVENEGDFPVELGWNNRKFVVEPGQRRSVPIAAAINAVGDPRSGVEPRVIKVGEEIIVIPSRLDETARMRLRYSIFDDPSGRDVKPPAGPEDQIPDDFPTVPKLALFLDDGTRLTTVLEDPKGEKSGVVLESQPDIPDMVKLVERMQRQINLQKQQIEEITGQAAKIDVADPVQVEDLPTDDPSPGDPPRAKQAPRRPEQLGQSIPVPGPEQFGMEAVNPDA